MSPTRGQGFLEGYSTSQAKGALNHLCLNRPPLICYRMRQIYMPFFLHFDIWETGNVGFSSTKTTISLSAVEICTSNVTRAS